MIRHILVAICALLYCSCDGRPYEDGVRSRLKWVLGIDHLPANLVIGASTIDWGDEWPTYQIELTMTREEFDALLGRHAYEHIKFTEPKPPNEQHIELTKPFSARGVYRRRIEEKGVCSIFYEAEHGRYFLLYMDRPSSPKSK